MDPMHESAVGAIRCLERELLVRAFLATLNDSRLSDRHQRAIGSFLDAEVTYRPDLHHHAHGREAVVQIYKDIHGAFDVFHIEIVDLLAAEDLVIVEHRSRVELEGQPPQELMGFSSFRLSGDLISEWHQIHS